jgi:hypothetical protein
MQHLSLALVQTSPAITAQLIILKVGQLPLLKWNNINCVHVSLASNSSSRNTNTAAKLHPILKLVQRYGSLSVTFLLYDCMFFNKNFLYIILLLLGSYPGNDVPQWRIVLSGHGTTIKPYTWGDQTS